MFKITARKQVKRFLQKLDRKEQELCIEAFERLAANPFMKRPRCDISELSVKKAAYRLRVGRNRFNYDVMENIVIVIDGFRRGRGYR